MAGLMGAELDNGIDYTRTGSRLAVVYDAEEALIAMRKPPHPPPVGATSPVLKGTSSAPPPNVQEQYSHSTGRPNRTVYVADHKLRLSSEWPYLLIGHPSTYDEEGGVQESPPKPEPTGSLSVLPNPETRDIHRLPRHRDKYLHSLESQKWPFLQQHGGTGGGAPDGVIYSGMVKSPTSTMDTPS